MFDPYHERNCHRRDELVAYPRRRRRAQGAPPLGTGRTRNAFACRPLAYDDAAGGDGRHRGADRTRLL